MLPKPYIFREYDIRGIVAEDFTGEVPELIGRAYATALRRRFGGATGLTVAVGRDNRPSSPGLAEGIIRESGPEWTAIGTVVSASP